MVRCKASSNPSAQSFCRGVVYSDEGGAGDCRRADDGQRQEVSAVDGDVLRPANVASRSGERFQGKNCWMSSGDFPPAAAQLSKYHVSHNRGLICKRASVANNENIVAASRPLHKAPEP